MNFTIRDGDKRQRYNGYGVAPLVSDKLVLEIEQLEPQFQLQSSWNETDVGNLSQQIVAIANTLMLGAELRLRAWEVRCYERSIQDLAEYEEELRLEKLEQERQAARKKERERKLRIATLLRQAANMQKADTIRALVSEVLLRQSQSSETDQSEIAAWAAWASSIANDLDPRLLSAKALLSAIQDSYDADNARP